MDKMTESEKAHYRNLLLQALSKHVGQRNAISMADLYEHVFFEKLNDKHNDTRILRRFINELRADGVPVISSNSKSGGGYYLASVDSELKSYCDKIHARALKLLKQESRLLKRTLPELVGQMQLSLSPEFEK